MLELTLNCLPGEQTITFRLLNEAQAIDVFEYLPPEVQEKSVGRCTMHQVFQLGGR